MGEAAEEIAQQEFDAEFFRGLPERDDVVAVVRAPGFSLPPVRKVFRHTGRNLVRRLKCAPDLAVQIAWSLRSGMSARAVAIRFSISPNSVVQIRESLREKGELEAVAKRVDSILDRFIELSSERIEEGILMGEVHPGQLPIPLMAAIDKRSQRDAGMVLGTERTRAEVLLENLDSAWSAAKKLAAIDAESNALRAEVVEPQPPTYDSTQNDTAPATASDPAEVQRWSDRTPPPPPAGGQGGGGGIGFVGPAR